MGLLDCFRVFVAGCLVLGNEVCTLVLATSNRLKKTALLCIGMGELTSAGWITRGKQTWLIFTRWLELSGQMAMIDSVIDILKPVKVMVHKLEVTGTLENVNKGNIYVKFPASFLNNNQFLLRNQSS